MEVRNNDHKHPHPETVIKKVALYVDLAGDVIQNLKDGDSKDISVQTNRPWRS